MWRGEEGSVSALGLHGQGDTTETMALGSHSQGQSAVGPWVAPTPWDALSPEPASISNVPNPAIVLPGLPLLGPAGVENLQPGSAGSH